MSETGINDLIRAVQRLEHAPDTQRRRDDLVGRAESVLGDRDLAEYVYDVATEEQLDPALAFEVVFSRLAVCAEPDPPVAGETIVDGTPDWVEPPALDPVATERERRLRSTFRRVRHFLEASDDVETALRRFSDEPDVRDCGY